MRSDQNFNNSQVILVEDNTQLASIPSTFQYGPEIHVSVTFNLDGSITGTVSEPAPSTNTFSFSFGPHAIQSTSDNFSIDIECSSGPVGQRIDDVVIGTPTRTIFTGIFGGGIGDVDDDPDKTVKIWRNSRIKTYIKTDHSRKWSTKFDAGCANRSYRSAGNANTAKP